MSSVPPRALFLAFALACTITVEARGQDDPRAAAKEHLERGLRYFSTQEYGQAIAEFKAGYQLDPNPDFLYALGQAQRLGGNCRDAVQAYKAFLRANPPAKQAELARGNLTKCEEELAHAPPLPAPAPTTEPSAPDPEAPRPAPTPPPPTRDRIEPPPPAAGPFYTDWLGDALAGLGVVGLAVGGGLWIAAAGHAGNANEAGTTFERYEAERDSAHELQVGAIVAGGIGGALLAAGVIRFATRPTTVSFVPSASGVRVALGKRF